VHDIEAAIRWPAEEKDGERSLIDARSLPQLRDRQRRRACLPPVDEGFV